MNVALFKITLTIFERKDADVAAAVYMTTPKCWLRIIFDPNAGEIISCDFTFLKEALRMIAYKNADIIAITDVAISNFRVSKLFFYAQSCAD